MITYESEGLQAKPLLALVWCWNEVNGVIYRTPKGKQIRMRIFWQQNAKNV